MKKVILFLPLLLLIIGGCSIEQPGTPKWQVEMTLPIADRQYSMYELVADSSEIGENNNWITQVGDTLIFHFADSLDRFTIEDQLKLDSFSYLVENYVGVRSVNAPGLQTALYLLDDVAPELSPFVGQSIPVGAFDFNAGPEDLEDFPEYDWVYLDYGEVTVTVTNNLPVPVENLQIDIYGKSPHLLVIHTDITGPLAPGESDVQVWPLPLNQEIDNQMEVFVTGHSEGSATPVLIEADASLEVDVELSELGIISASAHIPTQNFDADTSFALVEEDTVLNAVVKEAMLSYTITNYTELYNNITFTLPDFTLDGNPLMESFQVAPNDIYSSVNIDLSGYTFSRPQKDGLVQADVDVNIVDTQDPLYNNPSGYVVVAHDQMVGTNFAISEMIFEQFSGILDTLYLDIEQDPVELEGIPEGFEGLGLEYANLDLKLTNSIGLPMYFDIYIDSYKDGALVETLNLPALTVEAGDTLNPTILDTILTGFESLLNIIPDAIEMRGESYVYGDVVVGEWQWMDVVYEIYTPFSLEIGDTYFAPEYTKLNSDFENFLHQVDMVMELETHAPLSGDAFIMASFDSAAFENPALAEIDTFIHVVLPPADLDANGYVIQPGISSIDQLLDIDQLEMFASQSEETPLWIKTLVTINSTQGSTVRIKPSDYVTVGAYATAIVDVDFEGEEEGGN